MAHKDLGLPDLDPKSPAGQRVAEAVQSKLVQYLGPTYTDKSLAQYVVVMLAHKTRQAQLADNVEEFLGGDAGALAQWYVCRLLGGRAKCSIFAP